MWGADARRVWAVGEAGRILHQDGTGWRVSPSPTSATLYAVWGASASERWAVGARGTLRHYEGSRWTPVLPFTEVDLIP